MPTIKFRIDKKGLVHQEVSGAVGQRCEALTVAFEEALGVKTDVELKPEFYVELEDTKVQVFEE